MNSALWIYERVAPSGFGAVTLTIQLNNTPITLRITPLLQYY